MQLDMAGKHSLDTTEDAKELESFDGAPGPLELKDEFTEEMGGTRLNSSQRSDLVCRLLLEKKKR